MAVSRKFSEDLQYYGMLQRINVISPFSSLLYAGPEHMHLKPVAIFNSHL
jgi:hypothetical protein